MTAPDRTGPDRAEVAALLDAGRTRLLAEARRTHDLVRVYFRLEGGRRASHLVPQLPASARSLARLLARGLAARASPVTQTPPRLVEGMHLFRREAEPVLQDLPVHQ